MNNEKLMIAAANASFAISLESGRSLSWISLDNVFKAPAMTFFTKVGAQPTKESLGVLLDKVDLVIQQHIENLQADRQYLREYYLGVEESEVIV